MKPKHFPLKLINNCYNWIGRRHNNLMSRYAPEIYERNMIHFIRSNNNGCNLLGAEIGVDYGRNSECFLKCLPIDRLYLVDPYTVTREAMNKMLKRMSKYKNKIKFIQDFSYNAIDLLPDDFDFIYVGTDNNDYESVKRDINLFYPKIRKGGILGGCAVGHKMASQKAVLEFVDEHNLELHHTSGGYDWWVVKQ